MASAYRPGTNEIMQPIQENVMALLSHHGLVGDDAARAPMLCSAPIDATSAALCDAELKLCPTIPTVVTHGTHTATPTVHPPFHGSLFTAPRPTFP
eukprot:3209227-Prymnesium_polylepis.1